MEGGREGRGIVWCLSGCGTVGEVLCLLKVPTYLIPRVLCEWGFGLYLRYLRYPCVFPCPFPFPVFILRVLCIIRFSIFVHHVSYIATSSSCIMCHTSRQAIPSRVAFDDFYDEWDALLDGWRDGGMRGRQNLFFSCVHVGGDVDVVGGVEVEVEVIVEVEVVMCM